MANGIPTSKRRPTGRRHEQSRPTAGPRDFDEALRRLAAARMRYEDLRMSRASSLADRFDARRALDGLRLEMAQSRRSAA